jgi:hypothetical protein
VITLDQRRKAHYSCSEAIFDGIIPFKMTGQVMHLGNWDPFLLDGVENCYIELKKPPRDDPNAMDRLVKA